MGVAFLLIYAYILLAYTRINSYSLIYYSLRDRTVGVAYLLPYAYILIFAHILIKGYNGGCGVPSSHTSANTYISIY